MQPYCKFLEQWWVAQSLAHYKTQSVEVALEAIREPVARLSDLFTLDRPKQFVDYANDVATRLAYGLFFFPQSFMRARFPMRELLEFRQWKPDEKTVRVLDLGAGLGGVGLGVAWELACKGYQVELTAVDHSPKSLEALHRMHAELRQQWPWLELKTQVGSLKKFPLSECAPKAFDMITIGFASNEIWGLQAYEEKIAWVHHLKQFLKPNGLIMILEPALKATCGALYAICEKLIERHDWLGWGPLLASTATVRPDEDHEVRMWNAPESMAYINRKLFRDLRFLKYALAILGRTEPKALAAGPHWTRLDTGFIQRKGRLVAFGYADDGLRYEYEILTRNLKRSNIEAIAQRCPTGAVIAIDQCEVLGKQRHLRITNEDKMRCIYSPYSLSI